MIHSCVYRSNSQWYIHVCMVYMYVDVVEYRSNSQWYIHVCMVYMLCMYVDVVVYMLCMHVDVVGYRSNSQWYINMPLTINIHLKPVIMNHFLYKGRCPSPFRTSIHKLILYRLYIACKNELLTLTHIICDSASQLHVSIIQHYLVFNQYFAVLSIWLWSTFHIVHKVPTPILQGNLPGNRVFYASWGNILLPGNCWISCKTKCSY